MGICGEATSRGERAGERGDGGDAANAAACWRPVSVPGRPAPTATDENSFVGTTSTSPTESASDSSSSSIAPPLYGLKRSPGFFAKTSSLGEREGGLVLTPS